MFSFYAFFVYLPIKRTKFKDLLIKVQETATVKILCMVNKKNLQKEKRCTATDNGS